MRPVQGALKLQEKCVHPEQDQQRKAFFKNFSIT